jgi:transposase
MYRVILTKATWQQLNQRARQRGLAPRTRDRIEMVRLSAAGWSVPQIANHLQFHERTVRTWVKTYLDKGMDALIDQPHSGQPSAVTPDILAQMRQWIEEGERTWNAPQIATQVQQVFGLTRSPKQWGRLLRRAGLTYKRTRRTLHHKQKPEQVAHPSRSPKSVPIWRRCKKGESGLINLCFEDEAGFVMTLSPSYSWSPLGQPISVAHEAPQGRRINVLGAYFSHWPLAGRFVSALYATLPIMPLCLLCRSA